MCYLASSRELGMRYLSMIWHSLWSEVNGLSSVASKCQDKDREKSPVFWGFSDSCGTHSFLRSERLKGFISTSLNLNRCAQGSIPFKNYYYDMRVSISPAWTYICNTCGLEEGVGSLGYAAIGSCELPCWCWDVDQGPQEEQCASLTTDSSLQFL